MSNLDKTQDLHALLDMALDGELTEQQLTRLDELIGGNPDARRYYAEHVTMVAELEREIGQSSGETVPGSRGFRLRPFPTFVVAASLALVVGALIVGVSFLRPSGDSESGDSKIAKIVGLGGSVLWTGDGGRVTGDLSVGTTLTGGTIEGTTPDSWVELEFFDGSTVMVSGSSRLTFSDFGQKELHLREGRMSASVNPQEPDSPMFVHTRSARLEVLGTQFKVETDLASTALNVTEGKVRVKRLSDGRTVDVPANHRVIAAAEVEMLPETIPESVRRWKSQLHLGPDGTLGKWSPKTDAGDAKLRAVPYLHTTPQGQTFSVYVAGLQVSEGDKHPVVLQAGSRIRVRGRLKSASDIYFGVTVRRAAGGFAGNFFAIKPASEFESEKEFEVVLDLHELQLDPALAHLKDELPKSPVDGVIESFYCTSAANPAGLEIVEVEMIQPNNK